MQWQISLQDPKIVATPSMRFIIDLLRKLSHIWFVINKQSKTLAGKYRTLLPRQGLFKSFIAAVLVWISSDKK